MLVGLTDRVGEPNPCGANCSGDLKELALTRDAENDGAVNERVGS